MQQLVFEQLVILTISFWTSYFIINMKQGHESDLRHLDNLKPSSQITLTTIRAAGRGLLDAAKDLLFAATRQIATNYRRQPWV